VRGRFTILDRSTAISTEEVDNTRSVQAVALVAFLALTVVNGVLTYVLMGHRTDRRLGEDRSGGPSWAWQLNVYLYASYDERGQKLKRWVAACTVLQFVAAVLVVVYEL
jgi:hypothetical protein